MTKIFFLTGWFLMAQVTNQYATVIPVNDQNVRRGLSPYNWVCGDGYICSSVNGASISVKFKGTTKVSLQVGTDKLAFRSPDRYPIIAWRVNGGDLQTHQLVQDEASIILSSNIADPVIDLYIRGMSPFEDRFTGDVPPNAVKISGFAVDEGGHTTKVKVPRKNWLTIGDSILSGDAALLADGQGRPADDLWAASDEARASYGYLLANHLGYRESRLAFGGYDWGGGMAKVPTLSLLIDQATSTVSRLEGGKLRPVPDVGFINLGENGSPADRDVIDALVNLRSRVARATEIIVMIPVSGRARTEISRAFASYKKASGDSHANLIDLGNLTLSSADGQHPNLAGHEAIYLAALPVVNNLLHH